MSSGGGSNGVTRYDWNPFMENMWAGGQDGNTGLLNRAITTLNAPYTKYDGNRIAPLYNRVGEDGEVMLDENGKPMPSYTKEGIDRIRNIALNGSEPANAADTALVELLTGKTKAGKPSTSFVNPYEGQDVPTFTQDASMISGEVTGKVAPGKNEFMGVDSAPFNAVLDRGLEKIGKNYKNTTEAETRKLMNLSGIFGGGAHQQVQDTNEENLAEQMGAYTQSMLNDQINRSAGLREADLGRDVGAQQFNIGTQGQNIDRNMTAQQFNLSQAMQNAQMQNAMSQFNRTNNQSLAENRFGRQMQAIPMGFEAENRGFRTGQALLGIGDIDRGYQQSLLDRGYQDWADEQNWERNNINWAANLLSQAQGGIGGQVTQQQPGYGINPAGGLLGGAMFGNAMGWWGR